MYFLNANINCKLMNKNYLAKAILIGTIIIEMFVLCGCDKRNERIIQIEEDIKFEEVEKENTDILEYETLVYKKENSNKEIFYPSVKNISEIGDVLNDVIYNKVKRIAKNIENKKISRINFKLTYYDREIISILFYGTEENIESKDIEYITDLNYNLPRNIIINFKDYFSSYDNNLIQKFKSSFNINITGEERIYFEEKDGEKYLVLYKKKQLNDKEYERKYIVDRKIKEMIIGDI